MRGVLAWVVLALFLVAASPAAGEPVREKCFFVCLQAYFPAVSTLSRTSDSVTFAVTGDQGRDGAAQRSVAELIDRWDPEFVVSAGDNFYREAARKGVNKYDTTVGAYYCKWLKDAAAGPGCPSGGDSATNRFYPSLGNHDYSDAGLEQYLSYFELPGAGQASSSGNERYYDVARGVVHLFVLNSNKGEPDGVAADSKQAAWLKRQLARSTAPWKIVIFHHAAYSSGDMHGSSDWMRWPFAEWGADAVVGGHEHIYERLMVDGIPYFVNGLGGASPYGLKDPVEGSASRFTDAWGAQRVTATGSSLTFEFITADGRTVDTWTARK